MAITHNDRTLFLQLRDAGLLPPRPSVLELGEGQWFGDVSAETLSEDIDALVDDGQLREELHQRMVTILCGDSPYQSWDLAKVFFRACLDYRKYTAIDFSGTPEARKIDLNYPVDLGEQFDILVNAGTAEHVFDVGQFFRTAHDLTRPGGLMIHVMPFRGWLEHGFYSFNSTFYWDLAAANGYTMLIHAYAELKPPKFIALARREQIMDLAASGQLGKNATLYAVMKKGGAASEFRVPIQHIYADATATEATAGGVPDPAAAERTNAR
jgi:SAM-dependent methyltransferase